MECVVVLSENIYEKIHKHLIREDQEVEEAAFIFATVDECDDKITFTYRDKYILEPSDLLIQTEYHIELTDEARKKVISMAHSLNTTIIECHSHVDQKSASFSFSDYNGFSEFVPHVMWRLGGKPYIALVFASKGFDGLVWVKGKDSPFGLSYINLNGKKLLPTNNSITYLRNE